jgi:hypothetical protein
MKDIPAPDVASIERNARELIKHGGVCGDADLTCMTCPLVEPCHKGIFTGKNRTVTHENIKKAAEALLGK